MRTSAATEAAVGMRRMLAGVLTWKSTAELVPGSTHGQAWAPDVQTPAGGELRAPLWK